MTTYWFNLEIQFKCGQAIFTDTILKSGRDESDALGSAWANILQRYPGAIYLAHAVV